MLCLNSADTFGFVLRVHTCCCYRWCSLYYGWCCCCCRCPCRRRCGRRRFTILVNQIPTTMFRPYSGISIQQQQLYYVRLHVYQHRCRAVWLWLYVFSLAVGICLDTFAFLCVAFVRARVYPSRLCTVHIHITHENVYTSIYSNANG